MHLNAFTGCTNPKASAAQLDTYASDSEGNAASVEMPLRFQGPYCDAETGLHYNRFRYYDPQAGRFTTQDPISLAGGINLYLYAPNPVQWVDPLGLTENCPNSLINKVTEDKLDRRRRHHSSSRVYDKHTRAGSIDDARARSSGGGAAQYVDIDRAGTATQAQTTAFRNSVEKDALRNSTHVPQRGGSDYYVHDAGHVIGYNDGKPTQYLRVEITNKASMTAPKSFMGYNAYLK